MSLLTLRQRKPELETVEESRYLDIPTARVFLPLLEPARYIGAHGGRGSGKSHFFAEKLVEKCIIEHGTRFVCIREIQNSLEQSVKRLVEDKIKKMQVEHMFRVLNTHIETPGDGIIIFQGMQNHTSESIKSLEGYHGAWVEEAQSLSQSSLSLLRPTIREEGSEIWFSWNPKSPKDAVDVFFRGGTKPPRSILVEANYVDNPWFPQVLRDDMEYDKRRDPDRYAHVWLGKYQKHSQARVFKNWRVGERSEFKEPKRPYYGADWGFSVDPSVLIRMYIEGRTLYIDREAYQVGCEIDHLPKLFDKCDGGLARKWPIRADSSKPDTISYMNRHGYPKMVGATKGKGSVVEGVEFLQSFDIVVHPDCTHVIDELTMYSFKVDKKTEEVLNELEDMNNHVIDSARYALEQLRKGSNYTLDNIR